MIGKRIISTFLVVLMLASALSVVISAEDAAAPETPVYEYNTSKVTPTMDYANGTYPPNFKNDPEVSTVTITTQEEKLATMDLRLVQDGYRMYVDAYSGEVAVENIATGDVMFTNPYNISSMGSKGTGQLTEDQQVWLLSQIHVRYVDTTNNNAVKDYYSYKDAVKGGNLKNNEAISQINVKYIKNGIRLEYSIGRIDTRYLVPEVIKAEKYEEMIYNVAMENGLADSSFDKMRFDSFFIKRDLDEHLAKFKDEATKEQEKKVFLEKYPWTATGPVYVLTDALTKEYKELEALIKKYCPDFSYEDLDEAHLELNYTPKDRNEALFKIALEYTIDASGVTVRMPANGIRFDESIYRIEYIEILPYMGAGQNPNSGYTFFPDGSGALFDFEELNKKSDTYFYGDVYGEDFAYYNIGTGSPHNQVVRYPVFGIKEDITTWDGKEQSKGFVAIVEEGESLLTLLSHHGSAHNTIKMQVNPRPYDQYKLSSAISVAGDAVWTVVSERKYTGDVKIKYIMLTDPNVATGDGYYETSYVGMAKAYRDYLEANGTLTRLTAEDVKADIPLYIETFGAIETTEKFLSIPYNTMKPLTSFGDIQKMYDQLKGSDITNINFILTGYTGGGLNIDQVPYNLKWDKAVRKDMKFEELIAYAKEQGFGLYPDFDFVFSSTNKMFDGLSLKKHAVMTIDGRYTSKREYSATRQTFVSYFELAISPAYFSHFYEKLTKNYLEYEPIGISVSTLGSYLNSDFDEDEPYNREDSKLFSIDAFKYMDEKYSKVMTSGGNAYSWKYVDYITDIATDSSRHAASWATVPFLGMVLHGYVQTAGTAINMEGNIDYAMLRAIENGTALKFILSFRNTHELKEYTDTNMYYSVRYDIWVEDLISRYTEINSLLKDVQTSRIMEHKFVEGIRIPDAGEIADDAAEKLFNTIKNDIDKAAAEKEALRTELQGFRKNTYALQTYINKMANASTGATATGALQDAYKKAYGEDTDSTKSAQTLVKDAIAAADALKASFDAAAAAYAADPSSANKASYRVSKDAYETGIKKIKEAYDKYLKDVYQAVVVASGSSYTEMFELVKKYLDNPDITDEYLKTIYSAREIAQLKAVYAEIKAECESLTSAVAVMEANHTAIVNAIMANTEYAEGVGLVKVETEEEVFDKYAAAENSVVYEVYENGKAFVLNFNNYAVKVEINGAYYTVDSYGYIVLNANA